MLPHCPALLSLFSVVVLTFVLLTLGKIYDDDVQAGSRGGLRPGPPRLFVIERSPPLIVPCYTGNLVVMTTSVAVSGS